jgi:hypothetical protein
MRDAAMIGRRNITKKGKILKNTHRWKARK